MRALVDTNVLIGFLLSPGEGGAVRSIFRAFLNDRFTLLLPQRLLNELIDTVSSKPRLTRRITAEQLHRFTTLLVQSAENIEEIDTLIPRVTRDPDDDYVIAYALFGRADYLVTGDKDLLILRGLITGLEIVTPLQFSEILAPHDLRP